MFSKNYFDRKKIVKVFLLAVILSSSFLLGGGRAEASSLYWGADQPVMVCNPPSQAVQVYWHYTDIESGGGYYSYGDTPIDESFGGGGPGPLYTGTVQQYPACESNDCVTVYLGCIPVPPSFEPGINTIASFYATTDKSIYNPGDPIALFIGYNVWSPYIGPINTTDSSGNGSGLFNVVANAGNAISSVMCFLGFGCDGSLPLVNVSAFFQGTTYASSQGRPGGRVFDTIIAPSTPGVYTIALTGCFVGVCGRPDLTFTVAPALPVNSCPATTDNNCDLPAAASGGTAGSCSSGYTGSCNYTCTNGVWNQNSNSCATNPTAPIVTVNSPTYAVTLPANTVTVDYTLTNGTPGTSCQVLDYQGNPIPGTVDPTCSGSVTFSPPTIPSTYSYFIQSTDSSTGQTTTSSAFTVTINPAASCTAITINNCDLPAAASGDSVGSCSSGYIGSCNYTCSNGNWNKNSNSCVAPASCVLPWGNTIASGVSVTAFQASLVVSPATCTSQARLCTNGNLSGSYTNVNCTVLNPMINSFVAVPTRIQKGGTSKLSWDTTDVASCTVQGTNGFSRTGTSGTNVDTGTITAQTTFTLKCDALSPQTAVVNIVPVYSEF